MSNAKRPDQLHLMSLPIILQVLSLLIDGIGSVRDTFSKRNQQLITRGSMADRGSTTQSEYLHKRKRKRKKRKKGEEKGNWSGEDRSFMRR